MTTIDVVVGLAVCLAALGSAWIASRRFDAWFPRVSELEVASVAGRALLTSSVAAVVGLTLSWWRIEAGLVPAGHGDLIEFRSYLVPVFGLLQAALVGLLALERASITSKKSATG